jgi:cell division protease FtsH
MQNTKNQPKLKNGNGKKFVKKTEFRFRIDLKNILLYLIIFFALISLFFGLAAPPKALKQVPISQILTDIKDQKANKVTIEGDKVIISYKDGGEVYAFKETNESIVKTFEASGIDPKSVNLEVKDQSMSGVWIGLISNFLPLVLMVIFFLFLFKQARGAQDSIFSFGQSRAKLFNKDNPKISFTDVAGVDEAKRELEEVVDFLKNPGKYRAMGARTPKGVLLIGPSGTGKTLLARAVAGEAGVSFFSMAGSEFMEMLVGVGASRVRDLFNTAKKHQPAIIFIDEIDAIGRQRGTGLMGGHDERDQTLNQILVEMDGFAPHESLVVMAATNRPDVLDPALIRPGRFDRRVMLDFPDIEGRKAILKIHMKNKPFVNNVDWDKVAKRTVGFSGADLENMLNEAAILAARLGKKAIDMDDLEEAATKVKLGPEKKRLQSDLDRKMTAYHEAGHAIVTHELPNMDPVHRISIISRGLSLGFTLIPPTQDRYTETRSHLLAQITSLLGGRAAEEIIFNEFTGGAASDISKATEMARTMVIQYGMSDLGPINLGPQVDISEMGRLWYEPSQISPEMAANVDREVKKILDTSYQKAIEILRKMREKLDLISETLITQETIDGDAFEKLMRSKK